MLLWMLSLALAQAQHLDLAALEAAGLASMSDELRARSQAKRVESIGRLELLLEREEALAPETRAELRLRLADLCFEEGRLTGDTELLGRAVSTYTTIVGNYPDYQRLDQATFYLGRSHALLGDLQAARTHWTEVLRRYPDSAYLVDATLHIAEQLAVDDATRAAVLWQKATTEPDHPRHAYAQYRLGWSHLELGDPDSAVAALQLAADSSDTVVAGTAQTDLQDLFGIAPPLPAPRPRPRPAPPPPAPCSIVDIAMTLTLQNHPERAARQQLSAVQCWVTAGDLVAARAALERFESDFAPGTPWAKERSSAEMRDARQALKRARQLLR